MRQNITLTLDQALIGKLKTIAAALLRVLWQRGGGILSTQVLQEFYVNVTSGTTWTPTGCR